MSRPLARRGDEIIATDTHIVMVASPGGPVPTPLPSPFRGPLSGGLSTTVVCDGEPAAILGSTAQNTPPHVPAGGPFQRPPSNEAKVIQGSSTVFIDEQPAARNDDLAMTCNDPSDMPVGRVIATGTVLVGD